MLVLLHYDAILRVRRISTCLY